MARWFIEKVGPRTWDIWEKNADGTWDWQGSAATHAGAVGLMVEIEKGDAEVKAVAREARLMNYAGMRTKETG